VKTTVATATLGLALILAGAPAFASAADMQTGPIQINTVRLYGGTSTDGNDSTTVLPGTAVISFTNQSAATATDVVFALETKGYIVDRFNDVGSFATGIPIKHTFPEAQPTDDMRVAVAEATFVDGTVWQNPDVVQSPQADATIGVAATRL
jgi:hypothetical protein